LAKLSICSRKLSAGVFNTNHVTPSLQGGVVGEPVVLRQQSERIDLNFQESCALPRSLASDPYFLRGGVGLSLLQKNGDHSQFPVTVGVNHSDEGKCKSNTGLTH
jgi:hypothetical protein